MKIGFKRGQKGFTLVELMVVMAIIAVLAAIVVPPVTGTKQTSSESQVKQDASNVQTAVGKYNADSNLAEEITDSNDETFSTLNQILGAAIPDDTVTTSNRWPEKFVQAAYATEFPETAGTEDTTTASVTILDKAGIQIATSIGSSNLTGFLATYNAVDFDTLIDGGYLQQKPDGVEAMFTNQRPFHNYLWLVKRVSVDGVDNAGRVVEVYSLKKVQKGSGSALTYQRIY